MDTSRQRVLARGGRRGRSGGTARPTVEALATAYAARARERVAVGMTELDAELAARFGLETDDELLAHAADDAVDDPDTGLVVLAPELVVHAPGLMAGAVLTHRLTAPERAEGHLVLDADLAGFARVAAPHWVPAPHSVAAPHAGEPLDVDEVDGDLAWIGPEDWLTVHPEGALLAVRVAPDGAVTLTALDAEPAVPSGLVERLRAVYDAEVEEPGLPVAAESLILGVRHGDPSVFADPVPPLDDLAAAAGLERRGPEFAHDETVWATGEEADRHFRLIDLLGTEGDATTALEVLELLEAPDVDVAGLRRALDLMVEPDVVAAVTDELLGEHEDPAVLAAVADRLVAAAGRSPRAAVARWMAAVAAERDGRVLDGESHLRAAASEAAGWAFVEDRLAWYESDRGDAAAAVGRWRALGVPEDDPDLATARRFADVVGPAPARNGPCPCGSGRKAKQCHAGRPLPAPLPERTGWLWRKALAYLERRGGAAEDALGWNAAVRAGEGGDVETAYADPLVGDVTLHEDGWFARFLAERGPLLPADEAALAASWLDVDRTVFEVLGVRPGDGLDLRDRHTGDELTVAERTASTAVTVGTLLCARAVPDGEGHRLVGAVLPVEPERVDDLLDLLAERVGADLLEWPR